VSPDRRAFYRGLLLALRARRDHFVAHGQRFHGAFDVMLRSAPPSLLTQDMMNDFDPVFGVHRTAEEMIVDGMATCLLTLDAPGFVLGRFTIAREAAEQELGALPDAASYRALAELLHHALGRKLG
jgi:hypothetical protein